ncbi:MAG TPA: haloacid dehalogenase type II [Steroidobacteraceae bacterium]|jgi:2-haloacid dehalogenase|nr:haloacid dehalogenase type II [Steroidobacteraceae bacterium]
MPERPLLIFDVNETLLDLDALLPHFERIFGDPNVMREWFAQLVLYSQATTLAGEYSPFGTLGGAVLRMLGRIKRRIVTDADVSAIAAAVSSMPPHADVEVTLARLRAARYRMFTLTNNPAGTAAAQLAAGKLAGYFERMFSVDEVVRRFKPAPETYRWVARELGVSTGQCCLIACHVWDTLGAAAAGMRAALVLRAGNAPLAVGRQPDIIGDDLTSIADALLAEQGGG